jgi:cytochrome c-type biogenesis protein CcmH
MIRRCAPALLVLLVASGGPAQDAPELAPPTAAVGTDLEAVTRVVGAPQGRPLSGPALDEETQHVAALLRCPVCQGLSVADSPAETAVNMRNQVRDLVAAGFTQDQILAYFERSYGEFVRLEPPLRGVNWSLWLAPLVGLLLGGGIVFWIVRAPGRTTKALAPREDEAAPALGDSSVLDPLPSDPKLAEYIRRVRELAYGWPGGLRPRGTDKP